MKSGNTSVCASDAPAPQHAPRWPAEAWRLGVISGAAVAALCFVYLVVLVIGLATLPSPDHPVQQPWFALLELLILFIAPAMVALAVAICCSASRGRLPLALLGLVFFAMCALTTGAVHFGILVLGGHAAFAGEPWSTLVFRSAGRRWRTRSTSSPGMSSFPWAPSSSRPPCRARDWPEACARCW
ncbi:hypothetical protein [Hydrogenophaga taeniospiralis]|uniref:hypothetical protein n=1 Tax=Hydrogenophaga taeniospiralis TaxID=65656 RepID=UPI001CFB1B23|nr:hypothetical protein [Hydrogenophaga taeniospiralis]UCU95630.1 hypothetical protein KI616_07250 [Hydrogenophaga taeniospiralis]